MLQTLRSPQVFARYLRRGCDSAVCTSRVINFKGATHLLINSPLNKHRGPDIKVLSLNNSVNISV